MPGSRTPLFALLLLLFSCPLSAQLRVSVPSVPAYTPTADTLFLVGSFNDWAPHDERFALERQPDGSYVYGFTTPMPDFTFKITRGSWPRVESGPLGEPIADHVYRNNGELRDTLIVNIEGWEDLGSQLPALDTLTLLLADLPPGTPADAGIFATGSFNGWTPRDEDYRFRPGRGGQLRARIPLRDTETEFKITRGSWAAIESRENGLARPNRRFTYREEGPRELTVRVANWEDLEPLPLGMYAIVLLLAALQLLLIALVLLTFRARRPAANRWLAALVLLVAGTTLVRLAAFDKGIFQAAPKLILLPDVLYFLLPPVVLLTLRAWRGKDEMLPRKRWLFLPALLALGAYLPYLFADDFGFLTWVVTDRTQTFFRGSALAGWVLAAGFLAYGWRRGWGRVTSRHASLVRGLLLWAGLAFAGYTLTVLAGVWAFWCGTEGWVNGLADATWMLLNGLVFVVAYALIRHPDWFRKRAEERADVTNVEGGAVAGATAIERGAVGGAAADHIPPLKEVIPAEERTPPPSPTAETPPSPFVQRLTTLMREQRPHRNAKLTVADLATLLDLPTHQFSRRLNEELDQSFFEFVNAHRIADFRELVRAGRHRDRTILALGYEVGFNSKTAFNRAFRKQLGRTPRQIVQIAEEE